MKITIKRTEDQLALVRAMGSNNREEAYEAQAAVAELLGPVVSEVINNAVTIGNLFTTLTYQADDNPSLPLDLFHDISEEDYVQVYSQQVAGGLPYNQVFPAHNELKFSTYTLDSALAFDRKYAKKARVDVVSKTFTRMAQEVMLKQERTAFNVLASALVGGDSAPTGTGIGSSTKHVISAAGSNLVLDDFNSLITHSKRINSSFVGGTPVGGSKAGVTDLLVSPEVIADIRAMAYNPVNTRQATSGTTSMAAPEELRSQLYSGAGLPSFYGINVIEILELGKNQRFNKIFDAVAGSAITFNPASQQILIGVDRSRDALVRPVVLDEGSTGELSVLVDDQFSVRQNKIGYYGKVEEGRVCIDDRALCGIVL